MEVVPVSAEEYQQRLKALQMKMAEASIDCVYLPYGANQCYITGLNGQPTAQAASRVLAALVPKSGTPLFVVPDRRKRFVEKASWVQELRIWSFPKNDPCEVAAKALAELGGERGTIALDGVTPWYEAGGLQRQLPHARFVDASPIFEELRLIKSAAEISHIARAGWMADRALEAGLEVLRAGVEESAVAGAIYASILQDGGDVSQVSVISGKHKGFPEKTGQKIVAANELVMMFPKFSYDGYYADITRVAVVGEATPEQRRMAQANKDAHAAAVAIAKPGVRYQDVDKAGRKVLEGYGYVRWFTHGIGHGLGLATHEPPYVGTEQVLLENMIFTIEPSLYPADSPAVRVEDTFVVTADGCRALTTLPLDLLQR